MTDPTRHLAFLQAAIDDFKEVDARIDAALPEIVPVMPEPMRVELDEAYINLCNAVAEVDAEFWDVFEEEGLTPASALLATAAFVGFTYVA